MATRKRLLILGYELPPIGGGTGHALAGLLRAWPAGSDWNIELWTASPPPPHNPVSLPGCTIRTFNCLKKDLHFWRSSESALLLWKTWRKTLGDTPFPDAVLVWGGWPLGVLLLSSLGQVPSVLALRGSDVPGFNPRTSGPFWSGLCRRVWDRAGSLTANSLGLAQLARKTARGRRIEIIPNGVDPRYLDIPLERPDPGASGQPFQILCVSRLIRRKRVEWLVEALAQIHPEIRRDIRLQIVGDGPEKTRLDTMVQELGLAPQITFSGVVPLENMPGLYGGTHLFVQPSQAEGMSNALLEAMASGLPCLVAESTGFADLDETLAGVDSPRSLANQILYLYEHPANRMKMGEQARQAASGYSWSDVACAYMRLLERAAESPLD